MAPHFTHWYPSLSSDLAFTKDNLIGTPHATLSDDIFNGYFIPKGLPFSSSEQIFYDIVHQERPSYATRGQLDPLGLVFKIPMIHCRGISRDEKRYPKASSFIPERFLDVNNALTDDDPAGYVFGFGRRGCPGRLSCSITI
jgi:hypothetical protein